MTNIAGDAIAAQQDTLSVAALTNVLSITIDDKPCKLKHCSVHVRRTSTDPPQKQLSETDFAYNNFDQLQSRAVCRSWTCCTAG